MVSEEELQQLGKGLKELKNAKNLQLIFKTNYFPHKGILELKNSL